jgi:hypothetical protein
MLVGYSEIPVWVAIKLGFEGELMSKILVAFASLPTYK